MRSKSFQCTVLLVTGGTGGHIFPALALYDHLIKKLIRVKLITDIRGMNNKSLKSHNPFYLNVKGYQGKNIIEKLISLFLVATGVLKTLFLLRKNNITLVIGFGSYVQVPVIIAAKILNINIILHEANAILGKANKVFWSYVNTRLSFFKLEGMKNHFNIGTPVREDIKKIFKRKYSYPSKNGKINLLILGGSLGSKVLSYDLSIGLSNLPNQLLKKLYITHQIKSTEYKKVSRIYKLAGIEANTKIFINDISKYLSKANIIICRSGASTIAENLISGTPAIYFPLENSIENHQYLNAKFIVENKAGWMLNDNCLTEKKFTNFFTDLLKDSKLLNEYSKNCYRLAKPYATNDFYKIVKGYVNEKL